MIWLSAKLILNDDQQTQNTMSDLFEKSKDSGLDLPFLESDDVSEFAQIVGLKFEKVIKELDLGDKLNPVMKHVIYLLGKLIFFSFKVCFY